MVTCVSRISFPFTAIAGQQRMRHGLVLVATTVVAFWLALALTRRRFRG